MNRSSFEICEIIIHPSKISRYITVLVISNPSVLKIMNGQCYFTDMKDIIYTVKVEVNGF